MDSGRGRDADGQRERRRDLDRLRVLACLTTPIYHAIQIFDLNPYYHVKSATLSPSIDVAARLFHAVRMPLFFLLAGMAAMLAIGRIDNRTFLSSRARRLIPPFLFGIVLLAPWIKYIEVLDGRNISWSGITTLTAIPDLPTVFRRYFTQQRWFSWSHMWFLAYLLLLSTLLLPVLRRMRAMAVAPLATWHLALGLLGMLLTVELILRPIFPFHIPNLIWDWASMTTYVACFLAGAAVIQWPNAETTLRQALPLLAIAASIGALVYVVVDLGPGVLAAGRALWLWSVLGLAVGAGIWIGRGRIAGEGYISEAALPIYVLHHLPLVAVGYLVKDLPWPIWQRYVLILGSALVITFAIYHVAVRPFDAIRRVLGMPPRAIGSA